MIRCHLLCIALAQGLILVSRAQADPADDYLKAEMDRQLIPGAALVVVQDGQTVKTAAYGLANLELNVPVKPETVFEIGSVTKQFTAACILLLAQEGKLSLDDRISRHLGAVPRDWGKITIRHLLTHTSGLKSYTGLKGFAITRHITQEQFIETIGRQPLEFMPGESWKYCNTGYNLLGYIIENVSGKSYWDFVNERIWRPLGMNATTNRLPALVIPNRASGYELTNRIHINRDYDLTEVFSAGAIASTAIDLAKWNAGLDGEAILSSESKRQMWSPATSTDGKAAKYGLGWFLDTVDGHRNIGHGGSTSGFSASIQRFPDDHIAVILLTNTDDQVASTLARKIATFYFKPK